MEVANPTYFYEAQRVDINSKGKIRARKVNYIQASAVNQLNYPLKFRPKGPFKYFHARETWRITDFLFNPMVIMMVLPLLLIMVLPKMINVGDDQTQRVRYKRTKLLNEMLEEPLQSAPPHAFPSHSISDALNCIQ